MKRKGREAARNAILVSYTNVKSIVILKKNNIKIKAQLY
jgi:hypothetical protein